MYAVIKTGGVAGSMRRFSGPARLYESHDDSMRGILAGEVRPGEVVEVILAKGRILVRVLECNCEAEDSH